MTLLTSNNVLVPIDFSKEAHQALIDTLAWVKAPTKLHVIHMLHPLEPTELGMTWQTIDDKTRIDNIKAMFYKEFPDEAYQQAKFTVTVGHPSAEIIDYSSHNAIDLIVIPSSGRTGLARFFLGSVAERVVRFSHCPVLVIRKLPNWVCIACSYATGLWITERENSGRLGSEGLRCGATIPRQH